MTWIREHQDGLLLRLQIQPKASKTEIVGPFGASSEEMRLKIRVAAPPVEGAANEAVLHFLKKKLGIPAHQLEILRGSTSKMKDVLCRGISLQEIKLKLTPE